MGKGTIINHPQFTAIKRTDLSMPAKLMLEKELLKGRILDYGCGLGFDVEELTRKGYNIIGYDKYYKDEYPHEKFDTIFCFYVLDVLEPKAQAEVLMNISYLLSPKGTAYFAVQRGIENNGYKLHPVSQKYIYQCDVHLPFPSIYCDQDFELYKYRHINQIATSKDHSCFYCNLPADYKIICETATCYAFSQIDPLSPGHAVIVPKHHVSSYFDLTSHEHEAMDMMLRFVHTKIEEKYHPNGYTINIEIMESDGQSAPHTCIHLIPHYKLVKYSNTETNEKLNTPKEKESKTNHTKAYTLEEKRNENGNAYLPWNDEADTVLIRMYDEGHKIKELSEIFERTYGAIRSRLRKLGKIE